jgi:hypothetical protein
MQCASSQSTAGGYSALFNREQETKTQALLSKKADGQLLSRSPSVVWILNTLGDIGLPPLLVSLIERGESEHVTDIFIHLAD